METTFDFERDIKRKVHKFSYFAYGEASVHFLTLSKALTALEGMYDYARNAFIGAPNKVELENASQDVQEKFEELLAYFGGSVARIKACGNKDVQKHIHLLEEAYTSLQNYAEAVQKAGESVGMASLEERPYTIGVSTNVNG